MSESVPAIGAPSPISNLPGVFAQNATAQAVSAAASNAAAAATAAAVNGTAGWPGNLGFYKHFASNAFNHKNLVMNLVQNNDLNQQMSPFGFFPNMNLANGAPSGLPSSEITEIPSAPTNAKAMA